MQGITQQRDQHQTHCGVQRAQVTGQRQRVDTYVADLDSGFVTAKGQPVPGYGDGTPVETIIESEDRQSFAAKMRALDVSVPESGTATSLEEALKVVEQVGYPAMVRAAYSLGGLASGMVRNDDELRHIWPGDSIKFFWDSRTNVTEKVLRSDAIERDVDQ